MNKKIDNLFDKIYENRKLLIKYFIVAIICSMLRFVIGFVFSKISNGNNIISWTIWSIIFYILLKLFVFRSKSPHIYALLKQITIYILCIAVVWFVNQFIIVLFAALSSNPQVTLALAGFITEIVCLWLMCEFAFRPYQK